MISLAEKSKAGARSQKNEGIFQLLAYNTAQILRRRRLRKKNPGATWAAPMSWRLLFKAIEKSFELDAEALCTG